GDARAVCVASGEDTAVVLVDRCDQVPTPIWPRCDAMARRLHHPALRRGRREKIRLPHAGRVAKYDGNRRQRWLRRALDLFHRVVFRPPIPLELAGGGMAVVLSLAIPRYAMGK